MGGTYYNAKQYDQAIASFSKAVALNPNDFESMDLIAESNLAAGRKAFRSGQGLGQVLPLSWQPPTKEQLDAPTGVTGLSLYSIM